MGLKTKIVTEPALEPVTLKEIKDHLRIDLSNTDEDALLSGWITAARLQVEEFLWRALMKQTWDFFLDEFPAGGDFTILLPLAPLQSITSVKYIDDAGALITLAVSEYKVDSVSEPARLVPAFDKTWPATRDEVNAVEIRIVVGYADIGKIPQQFKAGIRTMVGTWFENRESQAAGAELAKVPIVEESLEQQRLYRFAE